MKCQGIRPLFVRPNALRLILVIVPLALGAASLAGSSGPRPLDRGSIHRLQHTHAGRTHRPPRGQNQPPSAADTSPLPTFSRTWVYNGQTFTSHFVGADPKRGPSTTHVKVLVVPMRLEFSDGTARDATSDVISGRTALDWILHSAYFTTSHFHYQDVDQGTTQFGDALLRLGFWNEGGSNPNYHLILDPVVQPLVTLQVPADKVNPQTGVALDASWLQAQQEAVINAMNPDPAALVVLVLSFDLSVQGGAESWHGTLPVASRPNGPPQTFILVAAFDNSDTPDAYTGVTFGHEVAEWLADPFTDNEVPPWTRTITFDGTTYDDSYNMDLLEVGDAFETNWDNYFLWTSDEGIDFLMQDTAYFDYFTRRTNSRAFHGWYSFNGAATPSVSSYDQSVFDIKTYRAPGAIGTQLNGINDRDDLVGLYALPGDYYYRGMAVVGGRLLELHYPGADATTPTAINHDRVVVGYAWFASTGQVQSFSWERGVFRPGVAVPGGTSFPYGINDAGDVGGAFYPSDPNSTGPLALLVQRGRARTFLPTGSLAAVVAGVGRTGLLAGFGSSDGSAWDFGFVGRLGHFEPVSYEGPGVYTGPGGIVSSGSGALYTFPSLLTVDGILGGTVIDVETNENGFYRIAGKWYRVGCGGGTVLNQMTEDGAAVGSVDPEGAVSAHGIIVKLKRRR
jgi:hypothetical protein